MNELIRKLTQEVKQKMTEILAKAETKSVIDATKAASDSGNFEVVISTADIDRQGESINQAGWDLTNYLKNPIVLWAHDYYTLPIGICESISVVEGKLVASGRFAPEAANPFAQQVRRLYDAGIVRATSVGLIVVEMEGHIVMKAELLEFSFVPVPANPYALSLSKAKELGLNLEMIAMKGLKLEVKEVVKATGDDCTMDDGSMGTMQDDGNGGMMCKPKSLKAEGDSCTMDNGDMGEMHPNDQGEMVCMPMPAKANTKPAICEPDSPDYDPQACGAIFCDPQSPQYDQASCDLMKAFEADKALKKTIANLFLVEWREKAEKKDAQQIGTILMQLQNIIDNAIVVASKLILDIIQSEYGKSETGRKEIGEVFKTNETIKSLKDTFGGLEKKLGFVEGEEHQQGGGAPEARSTAAEVVKLFEGLDAYLGTKTFLKAISTFASDSLERVYEKERKERKGGK